MMENISKAMCIAGLNEGRGFPAQLNGVHAVVVGLSLDGSENAGWGKCGPKRVMFGVSQ